MQAIPAMQDMPAMPAISNSVLKEAELVEFTFDEAFEWLAFEVHYREGPAFCRSVRLVEAAKLVSSFSEADQARVLLEHEDVAKAHKTVEARPEVARAAGKQFVLALKMRVKAKHLLKKSTPHKDYFASFDVFVENFRDVQRTAMCEHVTKTVQDLESRIATLEAQNKDLALQNKDLQARLDAPQTQQRCRLCFW
jgi:hypothetical protein